MNAKDSIFDKFRDGTFAGKTETEICKILQIPYREKNINIISIAIDAPQDTIASLSGKIGKLSGVSVKTAYSNVITRGENA